MWSFLEWNADSCLFMVSTRAKPERTMLKLDIPVLRDVAADFSGEGSCCMLYKAVLLVQSLRKGCCCLGGGMERPAPPGLFSKEGFCAGGFLVHKINLSLLESWHLPCRYAMLPREGPHEAPLMVVLDARECDVKGRFHPLLVHVDCHMW